MVLHLVSSPLFSLLFLLLIIAFFLLLRRQRGARPSAAAQKLPPKSPPSPPRLPIIGNFHQLAGALPHRTLAALAAQHGPLLLLRLGQIPTLVVSSPALACEVMKHQDHLFASRPSLVVPNLLLYNRRDVAFAPYGEYWRQVKKVSLLHLLSPKMVRSFRCVREEEVAAIIADVSSRVTSSSSAAAVVDVTAVLTSLAKHVISRVMLGKSSKDETWAAYVDEIMGEASAAMGEFHFEDYFPSVTWLSKVTGLRSRTKKMAEKLDSILKQLIASHRGKREKKDKDFVDILISLQDDPVMKEFITDDTIKSMIMDMYAAGMESTHIAIEWAMAELVRNPKTMKKLQAEVAAQARNSEGGVTEDDLAGMHYLRAVIKESLRLHPPGPLLVPRELMEETTVGGFRIPAGARTMINVWAIGRDARTWPEPEEFLPERFMGSAVDYRGQHFELTPFGAGRRICPGIGFSAAVVELALANLVHRFEWSLPDGAREEDMDMSEDFGITMRKKTGLQLVATPRF